MPKHPAKKVGQFVIDHGAEAVTYVSGVAFFDSTTPILGNLPPIVQPSPELTLGITLGHNYIDGVLSIAKGIQQLTDEDNYRQTQQTLKGVLNIISGIQICALTYTGGPLLAAPAFALSTFIDLITATIDFYNARKESEFEGWLEERVDEVIFLDKRSEQIRSELLQQINHEDEITQKIKEIEKKKANLLDEIEIRSKVHYQAATLQIIEINKEIKRLNEELSDGMEIEQTALKNKIIQLQEKISEIEKKKKLIEDKLNDELKNPLISINVFSGTPTPKEKSKEKEIQARLTQNYYDARENLAFKTLSFVAMTLIAVAGFVTCPPLLIAGLTIATVVTIYYLLTNGEQLVKQSVKVADTITKGIQATFFQPQPQPTYQNARTPSVAYGITR